MANKRETAEERRTRELNEHFAHNKELARAGQWYFSNKRPDIPLADILSDLWNVLADRGLKTHEGAFAAFILLDMLKFQDLFQPQAEILKRERRSDSTDDQSQQ